MNKLLQISLVLVLSIILVGCQSDEDILLDLGLDGLTAKEILAGIEDGSIEPDGYNVSVYDHELLILTDTDTISIPMPEEEFYISVAPYVNTTHECLFHSATGCRGELKNQTLHVKYVTEEGVVLYNGDMDTLSNGFIDLWLPRNTTGTLTISKGSLVAQKVIITESGAPTCETTMQLT